MPGSYRTHQQMNDIFKSLCDEHQPDYPAEATYEKLPMTTYQNNDIWLFKIGNPKGGRILFDGCMHGWEDICSEVMYLFINWLLTSGEEKALQILRENYWLVVPVLNYDSYGRGNANYVQCPIYGVDLNRNFVRGWNSIQSCGDVNNGIYGCTSGPSAGSEKETQATRWLFNRFKPADINDKVIYVNTHYGGGPYISYRGNSNPLFWTPLRNRILELWNLNGIVIHGVGVGDFLPTSGGPSGGGLAVGDAFDFGFEPFLIETCSRHCYSGHGWAPADYPCSQEPPGNPPYVVVSDQLYPIYKYPFIAMSESVAKPYAPPSEHIDDQVSFYISVR